MYRILKAEQLADKIYLMDVEAPGSKILPARRVRYRKD